MTFIILACALPSQKLWWPFFTVLFYALAVMPLAIAKRRSDNLSNGSSPCLEFALFLTAGIVLSSFAFPIVLAKSQVIKWTACNLTLAGNVIIFLTIIVFASRDSSSDSSYGGMF